MKPQNHGHFDNVASSTCALKTAAASLKTCMYAKEKLVLTFLWPLAKLLLTSSSFSSGKSIENSSLPGKLASLGKKFLMISPTASKLPHTVWKNVRCDGN